MESKSPKVSTVDLKETMAALLLRSTAQNTATKTVRNVLLEMNAEVAALALSKGITNNQSAKVQKLCGYVFSDL